MPKSIMVIYEKASIAAYHLVFRMCDYSVASFILNKILIINHMYTESVFVPNV